MPRNELLALLDRRPFQPFRITTTDNEVVEVHHPGMMLIAGNDITLGVPDPKSPPPVASRLLWLGFENITNVEPIEMAS